MKPPEPAWNDADTETGPGRSAVVPSGRRLGCAPERADARRGHCCRVTAMRTCAEAADAVHDVAEGGGLPVLVGAYFAVGAAPAVGPLAFQILTLGSVGLFP